MPPKVYSKSEDIGNSQCQPGHDWWHWRALLGVRAGMAASGLHPRRPVRNVPTANRTLKQSPIPPIQKSAVAPRANLHTCAATANRTEALGRAWTSKLQP